MKENYILVSILTGGNKVFDSAVKALHYFDRNPECKRVYNKSGNTLARRKHELIGHVYSDSLSISSRNIYETSDRKLLINEHGRPLHDILIETPNAYFKHEPSKNKRSNSDEVKQEINTDKAPVKRSEKSYSDKKQEEKQHTTGDGLEMKYFVLKPGGDNKYAQASREAMIAYAKAIDSTNPKLSEELEDWVYREERKAAEKE